MPLRGHRGRAGRRIAAALLALMLLPGPLVAQAPERSLQPLPRPSGPGALAGVSTEPGGALLRAPAPSAEAREAGGAATQLPPSMLPQRIELVVTGPQSLPVGALRAPPRRPLGRPAPRPPTAQAIAGAVALAAISPLAPARSLRPPARSAEALRRFTRLQAQRPAPVQPVAAGAGSRTTGRIRGGLCGVAALEGRELAPITSTVRGCGIAEPVSVTAVGGIRLSQPATLDCETARAFERWVRRAMLPAFGRRGGGVTQIRVAAHYSCRPRNNRAGARISEHGRGRAIDISGFRMANGDNVNILQDWRRGPYRQALRQMHQAACGTFRTTLGPGSDGFHEDHFHYDLARHRGGGTYCR